MIDWRNCWESRRWTRRSRGSLGELLSPAKRRAAVEHVRNALGRERVSERRACRVLGQPRSTQRRERVIPHDEPRLAKRMVDLATDCGRCGAGGADPDRALASALQQHPTAQLSSVPFPGGGFALNLMDFDPEKTIAAESPLFPLTDARREDVREAAPAYSRAGILGVA